MMNLVADDKFRIPVGEEENGDGNGEERRRANE